MNESKYSANFRLFNPDGLQCQFTVREDRADNHLEEVTKYINGLTSMGWSIEQANGKTGGKRMKITGWVLSTAKDNRQGGKFLPCVHLYSDFGKFKQVTVYHERIGELPFDVSGVDQWQGSAPDRQTAIERGAMQPCEFEIEVDTKKNAEGEEILTESGNTIPVFKSCLGVRVAGNTNRSTWRDTRIHFGKQADMKLGDISPDDLKKYRELWAMKVMGGPMSAEDRQLFNAIEEATGPIEKKEPADEIPF